MGQIRNNLAGLNNIGLSKTIDDWNNAVVNGYFYSNSSATNIPSGVTPLYWLGRVTAQEDSIEQLIWAVISGSSADPQAFRRTKATAGTWTVWKSVLSNIDEVNKHVFQVQHNWTAPQRSTSSAVASSATITLSLNLANDFTLTLAHNATLANPASLASYVGQKGTLAGQQDATGGRTMSYGSYWFPAGTTIAPAIPTAANAKFRLDYHVVSSTRIDFSVRSVAA